MSKLKCFLFYATLGLIISIFLFLDPEQAWARAGGARSKGGGIAALILWPFFVIYGMILMRKIRKRALETAQLVLRFSAADSAWELTHLESAVRTAFPIVQLAWMKRDQDICRAYVTDNLYAQHKQQTDALIGKHRTNILENIILNDVLIVQARDEPDNSKDCFWAFINGKMVDYEVDDKTKKITDGDKKLRDFMELWQFKRHGDQWLLNQIDSEVTLSDIEIIRYKLT